jgi:hypothetical protein
MPKKQEKPQRGPTVAWSKGQTPYEIQQAPNRRVAEAIAALGEASAAPKPFNKDGVKFVRSALNAVSENAARTLRSGGDTPEARKRILELAARDVQGAPEAVQKRILGAARVIVQDIGDTGDRTRADRIALEAGVSIGSDLGQGDLPAEPEDTRTMDEIADAVMRNR